VSIAGYDIINTDNELELRPTKLEIWIWKYMRQIFACLVVVFVFRDIFALNEPFPKWIWGNMVGFVCLLNITIIHKRIEPKPFIINRTTETITFKDKSIPFDDLIHFTVEAATFRDKVVMVTKSKKVDLTSGLSTKKAEAIRDILVDAVPFPLPRPGYFQSKIPANE